MAFIESLRSEQLPSVAEIKRKIQSKTVNLSDEEIIDPTEGNSVLEAPHYVIGAAVEGNLDALATIHNIYNNRILSYCERRVFLDDAEDCSQEVWFKVCRSIGDYNFTGVPFSSWLYKIARNTCFDHNRKASILRNFIKGSNLVGIPLEDDQYVEQVPDRDFRNDPEAKLTYDYDSSIIEALIAQLPPAQQLVVTLRYRNEQSIAETAKITRKTEGNVKSLTHKGVANMRKNYFRTIDQNGY